LCAFNEEKEEEQMKPEQAHKLAQACVRVVDERGSATAVDVFEALKTDRDLARDVPLTLPTISRALRNLFKTKRVRMRRLNNQTVYSTMNVARCSVCSKSQDVVELRPYGKNGTPICFSCAMSTPEMKAQTEAEFEKVLNGAGPVAVITDDGIVSLSSFVAAKPD
jgi:predicted transcriptional regulator